MRFINLTITSLLALASRTTAEDVTVTQLVSSPTSASEAGDWSANWVKGFPIHSSCNQTKFNQLSLGLEEAQIMADHARDHTLRYGNESEFFTQYFGNASTAEVIGWFSVVVDADKSNLLFRCDDIDGNCKFDGWAGHWRGENGSDETVICDLSFQTRKFLAQMCSNGYNVANYPNNLYWASDLLHRLYHTTTIGQLTVDHYADTYEECLELAIESPDEAVRNTASLRFYALDVYAYDIAVPGEGCSGEIGEDDEESTSSSSATVTTTSTSAATECHTHSDGEVHCA
ncbi:pH-regulated antigen pra1 [Komagataella kurtzmanii]|nr:pH-regulated antigen pra1 [Komagataella kurtzmanii]